MVQLVFIFITATLLAGFVALREYEVQRGERLFSGVRARLDHDVDRIEFILEHVDLAAFLREETQQMLGRVSHSIAHISLQVVRAIERLLTRLVRYLRVKHVVEPSPRESTREFVKTLSDFKDGLKKTHPEISDIS